LKIVEQESRETTLDWKDRNPKFKARHTWSCRGLTLALTGPGQNVAFHVYSGPQPGRGPVQRVC
jgi:hypothetical protein